MRAIALLQLSYLFLLVGSVFSAVHVDHAGSHGTVCSNEASSAYCHNSQPHEHEESHPGEDSLFEHVFEDGASFNKIFTLINPLLAEAPFALPSPEELVVRFVEEEASQPQTFHPLQNKSPRAPPVLRV